MPLFTHPSVADAALLHLRTNVTHLYYLSGFASTFAALGPLTLAQHAATTPALPADALDGEGRLIAFEHLSTATYTAAGTLNHVAFVDTPNARVLAVQEVRTPFSVSIGERLDFDAPFPFVSPRYTG